MENKGEILAFDLHKNKLSLVESGAKRLSIDIIKTEAHDAREPIEALFESADRVLCDVPCSGFGVIAKKPELRYKSPKESERLPDIQLAILKNCARYLKRGGTLVYSTCTVLPAENERNVERFLSENADFELCPFEYGGFKCESGMATLLPNTHGTDGFFVAKLVRK
jgi:16S rRNA (cytosine967-C5)-methyltransferase